MRKKSVTPSSSRGLLEEFDEHPVRIDHDAAPAVRVGSSSDPDWSLRSGSIAAGGHSRHELIYVVDVEAHVADARIAWPSLHGVSIDATMLKQLHAKVRAWNVEIDNPDRGGFDPVDLSQIVVIGHTINHDLEPEAISVKGQ
jgi:hypothetical protein